MNENYSELNTVGLKKKAVKGAGINVVTHSINFLFRTVGVIVLARLLTPKDFGLVAMVTAFSLLPLNFGFNGFTEFIIQKKHLSTQEINSIFWLHLFIAASLSFSFIIFGFCLVVFYKEPALRGIAAVMATSFILAAFYTTPRALLRRDMKFTSIAIGDLIAEILSIVFAIVAAVAGMAYWAVVTRQLSSSVVHVIVAWILCRWRPNRPRNLSSAVPAFKYALKVYSNFSVNYLTKSIDKVLLGKFHGSALLGNYDRAYYLSSLPAGQLLTPLNSVALATLSRLREDRERFSAYYIKAVSMVSFLGTIAAVVLMLSARDLIPLLLGPGWSETGLILMAFSPGIAAELIYGTYTWLHLSLGTPGRWMRWNLFATLITVISFIIAAPFGPVSMAIAYSAAMYLLVLPGLWYAGRPIELSITALIRGIWPYLAAAISICSFWLYLSTYWLALKGLLLGRNPISRIVITSFIALFLYLLIVIILQRSFNTIREVISLLRLMLSRKEA